MQSLVKYDVNIAITPHIQMIHRLILDGLAVATHRLKHEKVVNIRDRAIHYRFLRRTGHMTALKSLYNDPLFANINVLTIVDKLETKEALRKTLPEQYIRSTHEFQNNGSSMRGLKVDILIMSNFMHSGGSMDIAWDVVREISTQRPELKLVVFLG